MSGGFDKPQHQSSLEFGLSVIGRVCVSILILHTEAPSNERVVSAAICLSLLVICYLKEAHWEALGKSINSGEVVERVMAARKKVITCEIFPYQTDAPYYYAEVFYASEASQQQWMRIVI